MKVLLQRVKSASVEVEGKIVGEIANGLLLLVGFGQTDTADKLTPMADKLSTLRVFADEHGKFNLSLLDVTGEALLVPQFTLFADCRKGRRPDLFSAMRPGQANQLFDEFVQIFKGTGVRKVATGEFGAHMLVKLENDGPVTMMVEM